MDLVVGTDPQGALVDVWVVPGAARTEISGIHDGALRVRVAAPPERGRANEAVARVIAEAAGVRRGRVVAGHGSRRKRVLLEGVEPSAAGDRLAARLAGP